MKYLLKPKWKKSVRVDTVWAHIADSSKNAIQTEFYRYEEYKVEFAEGINVEEVKNWDDFDLDDEDTFLSYELIDNPISGDVTYDEWSVSVACTDEERETIEEGNIRDLEDWDSTNIYTTIQCDCEIILAS